MRRELPIKKQALQNIVEPLNSISVLIIILKSKYKKHVKNFSGILGILYSFNTQNLVGFEDTLKYKDELPFAAYCNCETTTSLFTPENREILPVSYKIIFISHPDLNLDRIIIERSFGHDLKLKSDYLNGIVLSFADSKTIRKT